MQIIAPPVAEIIVSMLLVEVVGKFLEQLLGYLPYILCQHIGSCWLFFGLRPTSICVLTASLTYSCGRCE